MRKHRSADLEALSSGAREPTFSKPATFHAFRIDSDRTLLVDDGVPDHNPWEPGILLINRKEEFVGRPSWHGRWIFGQLLWHPDAFVGVWLGEWDKTERPHRYRFRERSLEIDWALENGTGRA